MNKNMLANAIWPLLARWRNSNRLWGFGVVLNAMSFADLAASLFKFFRTWRGV